MEGVITRDPHVAPEVSDNKNLTKCKEVSKTEDKKGFHCFRVIKSFMEQSNEEYSENPKMWMAFKL